MTSLVRDLSETPRNRSSLEVAQALADMLRTDPVHTWKEKIADLDTPDYMMTFAGLVSTLLTLQLPPDQVDSLIPILADAFGLPEDIRAFLVEKYLPEVRSSCLLYFSFLFPCSQL